LLTLIPDNARRTSRREKEEEEEEEEEEEGQVTLYKACRSSPETL